MDEKALVFDIGDCIEPSTQLERESLEYLTNKYNLPDSFPKIYLQKDDYHEPHMFHAQGERKIMEMALGEVKDKLDPEKLTEEMQEFYWEGLRNYYTSDERGVEFTSVVDLLNRKNFKVGFLSDNSLGQGKNTRICGKISDLSSMPLSFPKEWTQRNLQGKSSTKLLTA